MDELQQEHEKEHLVPHSRKIAGIDISITKVPTIRLRYINRQGLEYDSALHGFAAGTHYQVHLPSGEEIVAIVGRSTSTRV